MLQFLVPRRRYPVLRQLLSFCSIRFNRWNAKRYNLGPLDEGEDDQARPGRWYHAGQQRTCEMLEHNGFTIVQTDDMGFDYRSPLIHFRK